MHAAGDSGVLSGSTDAPHTPFTGLADSSDTAIACTRTLGPRLTSFSGR